MITFVVPVRHHDSVADWSVIEDNLARTIASISAQRHADWRLVVVANRGSRIPPVGANGEILRVDFPCAPIPPRDDPAFFPAIERDKGRRVHAGLVHARPQGHTMVVDYDDLVSRKLAGLVAGAPDSNGWIIGRGYLYSGGSRIYAYPRRFDLFCGSSLIVNARFHDLSPDLFDRDPEFVRLWFGGHKFVPRTLAERGTPLRFTRFPAAIYRVGHAGNTSGAGDIETVLALQNRRLPPERQHRPETIAEIDLGLAKEFFGRPLPDELRHLQPAPAPKPRPGVMQRLRRLLYR